MITRNKGVLISSMSDYKKVKPDFLRKIIKNMTSNRSLFEKGNIKNPLKN